MAFTSKTTTTATKPGKAAIGCLVFFVLFWSCATLAIDSLLGWGAVRQIQATGFSIAPGQVTQSKLESHAGKHGMTYSPKISYTYRANGKDYAGDRYRYLQWSDDSANARKIVAAFPVGRKIDVFYAPGDPSQAVLKTGLEGSDLFLAMCLTPFNLIMLGMWVIAGRLMYRRAYPLPAGGAKIVDDGFTARVRLSKTSPLFVAAATLAVFAFLGIFAVLIAAGPNPPLRTMYIAWIGILIVSLIAFVTSWIRLARADNDLVIDDVGRHLTLPATFGRTEAVTPPLKEALAVEVEQIVRPAPKGGTYSVYAPTLVFSEHDGSERREKLTERASQSDAEALAAWLRERLRLAEPAQNPESDQKLPGGGSHDPVAT
jgi:hypothetical protein